MKLTNFTFLRAERGWLLKSLLPMLVFMTLSLGVEAQVVTPGDALASQQGISLVDNNVAIQRLATHIEQLEQLNPSTQLEEATVGIRTYYAFFILEAADTYSYKYRLLNDGLDYVQDLVEQADAKLGSSIDAQQIYNELVDLLES